MRRKKNKKSIKEGLISLLQYRMKVLQSARQNYEQNPNLMQNVKMANIELIQNDVEDLRGRFNEHKSKVISGKEIKKRLKK